MRETFVRIFGDGGTMVSAAAPGRVNLIGEHTDYNDGFVFPMAIAFRIELTGRLRSDKQVTIYSVDFGQTSRFSLAEPLKKDSEHPWSNYCRGVLWALGEAGMKLSGMDIAFGGNVPQGSGLSSSAALEVACALAAQQMLGGTMTRRQLAVLCQRAENDFVGNHCGVMDQFVSLLGKSDNALFLDCRSLDYQQIPLALGRHSIVICHSGVRHSLVESEYNRRRHECETGVGILQKHFAEVRALRDVTLTQLEQCRAELGDVVYKRCRHVISENSRVLESVRVLQARDLASFGRLMNASHDSLRNDYATSCKEVDLLVDLARQVPGVLGARITGGGFGGCTVNLVAQEAIEPLSRKLLEEYHRQTSITPKIFVSSAADGARIVTT